MSGLTRTSGISGPPPDYVARWVTRRISARLAELDEMDSPGEMEALQREVLTQALIRIDATAEDYALETADSKWSFDSEHDFISALNSLGDLHDISLKVDGPDSADDLRGCLQMLDRSRVTYTFFDRVLAAVAALRRVGHVSGANIVTEQHVESVGQLLELSGELELDQQFTEDLLTLVVTYPDATGLIMATVAGRGLADIGSVRGVLRIPDSLPVPVRESAL